MYYHANIFLRIFPRYRTWKVYQKYFITVLSSRAVMLSVTTPGASLFSLVDQNKHSDGDRCCCVDGWFDDFPKRERGFSDHCLPLHFAEYFWTFFHRTKLANDYCYCFCLMTFSFATVQRHEGGERDQFGCTNACTIRCEKNKTREVVSNSRLHKLLRHWSGKYF